MSRLAIVSVVLAATLALAACSERPQVVNYKQGKYAGKPDTPAYQNAPYSGDKAAWERALATRAQAQNEYQRIK
jgi:hypothetical protein